MRYKYESNSLYLYIALSLFIHILVFVIIPYGSFSVMGSRSDGYGHGYGFVQLVEYREEVISSRNQTTSRESTTPRTVVEEKQQEPEIKEIKEEPVRKEEKVSPPPETTVVKETIPPAPVEEIPAEKIEEPQTETGAAITEGTEIMTSAESDFEIEIDAEKKEEPEQQIAESKPVVEEKVETPPPPPPPPSAGELIFGAVPITYPKDLVGKAVTGTVEIQVHVSSSGLIEGIEIIKSSGVEQMDRVSRLTIEHGWQFKKYQQPYSMSITVDFQIDESGNPFVTYTEGNLLFR